MIDSSFHCRERESQLISLPASLGTMFLIAKKQLRMAVFHVIVTRMT